MSQPGKVMLKWNDFGKLMDELIDKIKYARLPVTAVYGPPVGGIFVAGVLSKQLGLTYIDLTQPLILLSIILYFSIPLDSIIFSTRALKSSVAQGFSVMVMSAVISGVSFRYKYLNGGR